MATELATSDAPACGLDLIRAAVAKGATVEQIQQLMDLSDRLEANAARRAYMEAMTEFKSEALVVEKSKHVRFQTSKGITEYDHALLSDVVTVVVPAMSRHGLSHQWTIEQDKGWVKVTCIVTHRQGHSERVSMGAPTDESGGKNAVQAIGSTTSYLQRYTLMAITGLAAKDMDDDGRGGDVPAVKRPQPQAAPAPLPPYAEAAFNANFDAWREVIESGKRTAAALIAMIETKGILSAAQRQAIIDLEAPK